MVTRDAANNYGKLLRLASAIIFIGNIVLLLRYLIGPLWIVLGLRIEVLSGTSYEYSWWMIVVAYAAIVFLIIFFIAQIKSWNGSRIWHFILVGSIAVFASIGVYEAIMAHKMDGLTFPVIKRYGYSFFVIAWAVCNAFFWSIRRRASASSCGRTTDFDPPG
jgi:hypothetical protein